MDFKTKEKIVNRICSGGFYVTINNTIIYVNMCLTPKQLSYLDHIWENEYNKAIEKGVPKEEEVLEILEKSKKWTQNDDKKIEKLRDQLKSTKRFYYSSMYKNKNKEAAKEKLDGLFQDILTLMHKRSMFIGDSTAEFYANAAKNRCKYIMMVQECDSGEIGNKIGDLILSSPSFMSGIEEKLAQNSLSEAEIREIARTSPWRNIWASAGKKPLDIFGVVSPSFSNEQKELCYWSQFYDSIYEAYDRPSDDIINDDVAIDAWYEIKIEENERKAKQSNKKSKADSCKEQYIVTDAENAYKVYEMNDPHVRDAMKKREKLLKESNELSETEMVKKEGKINAELFVGGRSKK